MEVHAATARAAATGSSTLADLLPLAVKKHAGLPAQLYKDKASGEWREVSYEQLGEIVKEASLGLQDIGIEPRRQGRDPRPHPSRVDLLGLRDPLRRRDGGAGLPDQLAPRSASTCIDHSEARAVILEDEEQLDEGPRGARPAAEAGARSSPWSRSTATTSISFDAAARARPRPPRGGLRRGASPASSRSTSRPTSTRPAPPGRPRAASSTTPTGARCSTWSRSEETLVEREVIYLFLPLAHAFARLIQLRRHRRRRARSPTGRRTRRRSSPT